MRGRDQDNSAGKAEREPLPIPRRLDGGKDEQRRPGRGGLRDGVHQDQSKRPLRRAPAQLRVDPAVQHARHGDGSVDGREGEPLGRLGHVPDDEDEQAQGVPARGDGNGPYRTEEQIR